MARHEADREDLWAEAVNMTSRAELTVEGFPQPLLVGFRENRWFSIYFGQDIMLQFTPEGGLRRAYRNGELYRTQGTTLARLRRFRTDAETTLLRSDLSPDELNEFQAWARSVLTDVSNRLAGRQATVLREVNRRPEPLLNAVESILKVILSNERFLAPAIPGKP